MKKALKTAQTHDSNQFRYQWWFKIANILIERQKEFFVGLGMQNPIIQTSVKVTVERSLPSNTKKIIYSS
jgi:hypothetical protein